MANAALTLLGPGPIEFTSINPTTVETQSGDTITFRLIDSITFGGPYAVQLIFTGYPPNPVELAAALTVTQQA